MSDISNIWLIAGTSSQGNSGSSDTLDLEITFNLSTGGTEDVDLLTSSSQRSGKWGSKSNSGDGVTYYWAAPYDDGQGNEAQFSVDDITSIDLEATGHDAWLPANLFVVMQDSDGNYTLMAANGAWPSTQCLSTDTGDCGGTAQAEYTLYPAS